MQVDVPSNHGKFEAHLQISGRQQSGSALRPFDQAYIAAIEFVAETGGLPLMFILKAI